VQPLNAMLGVSRLLESTNLSLEQHQYVGMIANSGRVLLSIVVGPHTHERQNWLGLSDSISRTHLKQVLTCVCVCVCVCMCVQNDILDYSKMEAGEVAVLLAPHSVLDVVESSTFLVYGNAVAKGLQLTWWVDPATPHALLIDSSRLQQIFLNLLSNGHCIPHAP
jgi:signal transduction histidine kinase